MDQSLWGRVLGMPPSERVAFAELVLASIEHEDDAIHRSWILEVKSRIAAVNEGKAKLLDFEILYHED